MAGMMVRSHFEDMPSDEIHRRVATADMLLMTTTHWSGVQFDPILTPFFSSLFASAGITGSIFGVGIANTLGSLATAIVTTGVSVGLQAMLAPKPPKPEDGKAPMTQPIPHRIWGVGTTRLAGAHMLWEAVGPNLYSVQAIAGHPIRGINRTWLHDDEVTVDGSGNVTTPADERYALHVKIFHRLGAVPEAPYAELVADLSAEGIWTSTHRGDGQSSMALVARSPKAKEVTTIFPYGIPRLSAEADLAMVWDFRDPDQDPDDPTTWTFSRNPVLQLCWHWCFNEFGHRKDYRKAVLPVLDMWVEEADICDEIVAKAGGGSEPRYECSGWDTTEREPKVGTNAILSACDGWTCQRGDGALLITVGKFRESRVVTLTDADIVGHQIAYDTLPEEEINRLVPKFNYPETDYSTTDTDFFEDSAAQLVAGRVLAEEMNLQWVTSWTQARRLGWREWQRIQQRVKGSLNVSLPGINAVYARWIRLETPIRLPRLDGALIENRRAVIDLMRGGFSLEFVKHPAAIDTWSTAMEGHKPPVPPKPNAAGVPVPVILSVAAMSSSGAVYLRARLEDPAAESLTSTIRYRVADIGGGTPGAWVEKVNPDAEPSGGEIVIVTDVVPGDATLDVQVAFIAANGKYGAWSPTEQVFSAADPVAPGPVTNVSATGGVGQATYNWRAPNSQNHAGVKLYWNVVNDFETATYAGPIEYGGPNRTDSSTRSMSAGTRYGWVSSINHSGIEGSPVPTGAFTVT